MFSFWNKKEKPNFNKDMASDPARNTSRQRRDAGGEEKFGQREKFDQTVMQNFHDKDIEIIDYLTEGILIFDEDNRLFSVNRQIEKFFKIRKEALLGKTIFELDQFPNLNALISFLGKEIHKKGKKKLKIRDDFILDIMVIPIMDTGNRTGALVVLDDITYKEIINKIKSEFVDLVTHQLWTPTSAVKWSLQMLLGGEFGNLNKEQKSFVEKIYKANDKAIKLIGDLSQVSQIEGGRYLSDMALSDIEEVISSLVEDYQKEIDKKRLKLEFKKSEEQIPKVIIDKAKMKIAIGNILGNAIKYIMPGGKIKILLRKNEKEIEIQISDTGLGVPNRQQKRVFTRFFRGSNIIQKDTEGTGLGLYISKSIIEAHNGRIWFISEEGKGTTFFFTIPLKKEFAEFITGKFY